MSTTTTTTRTLSEDLFPTTEAEWSLNCGDWSDVEHSDREVEPSEYSSSSRSEEGSNTRKNPCHESHESNSSNDDSSSWMACDEETFPLMQDDLRRRSDEESVLSKNSLDDLDAGFHVLKKPSETPIKILSKHRTSSVVQPDATPQKEQSPSCDREVQIVRGENRRLKKEVFRLRVEAREKDALIAILESQIMALVVSGQESDNDDDNQNNNDGEDDDIESIVESSPCRRSNRHHSTISESSCTAVSNASSLISPPKRSSVEMKHPPAPTPRKRIALPPSSSRKSCFQKSTAAIKALPRELSISNHSRYFLDDDSDDDEPETSTHSQQQKRHKSLSETYSVNEMEFIDAYNSRGIYTGTVQRATQMPHGKGKMVYHRGGRVGGRYYDGDWHTGHWHGSGILRDASGDIYEGQLVNDLREGIGTMQFTDGRIFQGRFSEDEAANGTMSYIDGAQYEGDLHHGNRHGLGVYRFSDGSYYEGQSVMNLFEGFGKMTWADGGWYEGDWSKGEIHGFGKECRPDGSLRHDGRWIKGVPIRVQKPCRWD
eukprot:CAMPEP_0116104058 /NCGR_PEP_ID=MMETSP0327-20121206/14239_1 /TAXON_ID=44447 /ORGANISM="Pseudo-nitzschia delicatissima, Strain B596" /LENGTH=542 /DNA_ID=CAMNT_0003596257 /DNA_START=90 /DNA_END=1721 /DNA_ORIENTATION=+